MIRFVVGSASSLKVFYIHLFSLYLINRVNSHSDVIRHPMTIDNAIIKWTEK